ncbi:hypothetical protein ScPMuIL_011855 [Solemya velum]
MKLGKSIPSTDPVVVSTTTSSSVGKTATNTVQSQPATKSPAKPVTPVAAESVPAIPKTTSVGGTQLKSLEAKPEKKTEVTLAPTVIAPEETAEIIKTTDADPSIQHGASISVQTGHGDSVALVKGYYNIVLHIQSFLVQKSN